MLHFEVFVSDYVLNAAHMTLYSRRIRSRPAVQAQRTRCPGYSKSHSGHRAQVAEVGPISSFYQFRIVSHTYSAVRFVKRLLSFGTRNTAVTTLQKHRWKCFMCAYVYVFYDFILFILFFSWCFKFTLCKHVRLSYVFFNKLTYLLTYLLTYFYYYY